MTEKIMSFKGFSMFPSLRPGDVLVVRKEETLYRGCVYSFKMGHQSLTHRLVDIQKEWAVFRGDARKNSEHVLRANIQGRVIKIFRKEKEVFPKSRPHPLTGPLGILISSYFWAKKRIRSRLGKNS